MREKHVLASVIHDRSAYDKIADHVEVDDFTESGRIVWEGVVDYYRADDGCRRIDTDLLGEHIARSISNDQHKGMFRTLVTGLGDYETSPANVVEDLLATKRERIGRQLAAALLAGEDGSRLLGEYTQILDATGFEEDEAEDDRRGMLVRDLCDNGFDPAGLIQVYPLSLNERLDGGLRPGHHIVVFGRPEMGKTMAVIEMMAGFARQDLDVLYIGNEDPLDEINMRIVNRLSGMTKLEVINNPDKADGLARAVGYENIILHSAAPGTKREITSLMKKYKPGVLVLDQLRNLDMGQDNYVLKLEEAATCARNWAKQYSCVVVSVTQAGDSASGKAVLDLGDVDYSNTGIPAQADVMIGLGATSQHIQNGELVYSLPKNKISGRHEYFACHVNPALSQILPA